MENCRPKQRPKQRAALRKIFISVYLTEIYRNIQTFSFKVPEECSSWASRNGAVQIFFSDTKPKHICRKISKVRKVFGCVAVAYYFKCQVS